jgi:hypothetical protein
MISCTLLASFGLLSAQEACNCGSLLDEWTWRAANLCLAAAPELQATPALLAQLARLAAFTTRGSADQTVRT